MTSEEESAEAAAWAEYESAAGWCAKREGTKGVIVGRLPEMISSRCLDLIEADPEAFEERVRATAYGMAMERRNLPEEPAA